MIRSHLGISLLTALLVACAGTGPTKEEAPGATATELTGGGQAEDNGDMLVAVGTLPDGSHVSLITASFARGRISPPWTEIRKDRCTLRRYKPGAPSATGDGANAGVIDIEGGLSPIALTPLPSGTYAPFFSPTAAWNGGELLTVRGAGSANVPAFRYRVRAPFPSNFSRPTLAELAGPSTLTIDRFTDYAVTWTPTSVGKATVSIVYGPAPSQPGTPFFADAILCAWDARAGSGTIPAELLSQLPPGGAQFTTDTRVTRTREIDDWTINLIGSALGGFSNGQATNAVLQ